MEYIGVGSACLGVRKTGAFARLCVSLLNICIV
jgi:hypothetical protein